MTRQAGWLAVVGLVLAQAPGEAQHLSLTAGKRLTVDVRGQVQADARHAEAPEGGGDAGGLDLAKKRLGIEGAFGKRVEFQVEGEVATHDPWRDVYIDYRQVDALRIRAGRFKLPVGLEQNTSSSDLDFVYRSQTSSDLTPGRDRGVMTHGRLWRRRLEYEAGVFQHDGGRAGDASTQRARASGLVAARVTATPFARAKSALADVHAAVSFTRGRVSEGISDLRGRTVSGVYFFPPTYWVSGARRRVGLEARWRPGPVSLTAEYVRVSDERTGQGIGQGNLPDFTAAGAYLSGTWAITGESKRKGLASPRRPIFRGGTGVIEVAARLERIRFGDPLRDSTRMNPRAVHAWGTGDGIITAGVNWYPSRHIKVQGDIVRERLSDQAPGARPGQAATRLWSRVVRLQFSL